MTLEPMPRARPRQPQKQQPPAEEKGLVDGAVGSAFKLAGWALRSGQSVARKVPGVEAAERGLQQLERGALGELRRRMDDAAAESSHPETLRFAQAPVPGGAPVITQHGDFEPLRATMAALLERSLVESRGQAREALYGAVLGQLTPDEARIMSALADGTPFALIDVAERSGVAGSGKFLMRYACSVGKAAGITLDDHVPVYVLRLIAFGLAMVDDEATELAEQYDILLTDQAVRAAMDSKRTKVFRRTLRIAPFGKQLWSACDPSTWQ